MMYFNSSISKSLKQFLKSPKTKTSGLCFFKPPSISDGVEKYRVSTLKKLSINHLFILLVTAILIVKAFSSTYRSLDNIRVMILNIKAVKLKSRGTIYKILSMIYRIM